MTLTASSPCQAWSPEETTAILARRPVVQGVLLLGSASRDALTPDSDYDVLLVLSELPGDLEVPVTRLDGRATDLLFATHVDPAQAPDLAHRPRGCMDRQLPD